MSTAAPYYRVPAVIFAVLVGGLYVYAKSGGAIFRSRTQVTPATNANNEELAPPRIEFMLGPKSAPAFAGEGPKYSRFADEVPFSSSNAATQPRQKMLPGSKSDVVFPSTRSTPSPPSKAFPANTATIQRSVFPGTKSAILVDPAELTPALQPGTPGKQPGTPAKPSTLPANDRQPDNNGPNNAVPGSYLTTNAAPQPRPAALPGSKSMILISPEAIQRATQNNPPTKGQQQLQLPANQVRRSR